MHPSVLCVPLLSVFWSDVDTSQEDGGVVWYRQTTDTILRQKALADIQRAYPAVSSIDYLFIATWDHVRYYSSSINKVTATAAQSYHYQFCYNYCSVHVEKNYFFVLNDSHKSVD